MKTRTIFLYTAVLTLSACSSNGGPYYAPQANTSEQNYTTANHFAHDRMGQTSHKHYEQRKPCQNYCDMPRHMTNKCMHCEKHKKMLPIVSSYTVLFDHDNSNIRLGENKTLDRAMREINQYQPNQITVTGYTDSSGRADYNQNLSCEREQAVSRALMARGIKSQTLERDARGEYEKATETKDGIRNQDNRRVVINFRR